MAYEKNTAGQQIVFAVIDSTTGNVVTGDAANISGVYSTDGAAAGLMGNSAIEIDALAMPGFYKMALRQIETNGDVCLYRLFSSTTNARIDPVVIYPVVYSDYQATAPTVQQIVNGVWDEPASSHVSSGTTGKLQKEIDNVSFLCQNIQADTQAIITVGGAGPWTTASVTAPTVQQIVDGVWDESVASHTTAGTTGEAQNQIKPGGVMYDYAEQIWELIVEDPVGNLYEPTAAAVWDRPINVHTITNTFGNSYVTTGGGMIYADVKRINNDFQSANSLQRIYKAYDIETDVANASADTVTFDDPLVSSVDQFYQGMIVLVHGGTGAGQARAIIDYDGGTKKATVSPPWGNQPAAGQSDCTILGGAFVPGAVWDVAANDHTGGNTFGAVLNRLAKSYGGVQGTVDGSSTTSTINSSDLGPYASGAFDHQLCVITSGALVGEARPILSQPGASLRFEELWTSAPAIGSEFVILPQHVHPVSEIADGVWQLDNNGETFQQTLNDIEANTETIITTGGAGPWTTGGGGGGGAGGSAYVVKAELTTTEPKTIEARLTSE